MNPNDYILLELDKIKEKNPSIISEDTADFIFKTLMNKKFRKYSASQ